MIPPNPTLISCRHCGIWNRPENPRCSHCTRTLAMPQRENAYPGARWDVTTVDATATGGFDGGYRPRRTLLLAAGILTLAALVLALLVMTAPPGDDISARHRFSQAELAFAAGEDSTALIHYRAFADDYPGDPLAELASRRIAILTERLDRRAEDELAEARRNARDRRIEELRRLHRQNTVGEPLTSR